jgi:hypothetical protein
MQLFLRHGLKGYEERRVPVDDILQSFRQAGYNVRFVRTPISRSHGFIPSERHERHLLFDEDCGWETGSSDRQPSGMASKHTEKVNP